MKKPIRVGIFGTKRGSDFYDQILRLGGDVVAICDKSEFSIKYFKDKHGDNFKVYTDFDEFINHGLDAVLLTNYFTEHAEYAIRCLEKGIHVLSECLSNTTMAEGVALCRAVEKSKASYMFAENYPFMDHNLLIKKYMDKGDLGKLYYAEGEYNHPPAIGERDPFITRVLFDDLKHWRRYLPRSYYISHSLAPLMYIGGGRPKRITAMPINRPEVKESSLVSEVATIVTVLNDNETVYRVFGCSAFGYVENSYRFCCEKGQVEVIRGTSNKVAVNYTSEIAKQIGEKWAANVYEPEPEEQYKDILAKSGHNGGDFYIIKEFFDVLEGKKENKLDVYFATSIASVGILAHRSQLQYGMPYDVPDFRKEEDKVKWENDKLTPFWSENNTVPPSMPCSTNNEYNPDKKALEEFEDVMHGKVYQELLNRKSNL